MCCRAWRATVGRFPYFHWTDHAQLVRLCMLALERIDPKHFRWVQEIVSNGSEIGSLAGRSMRLGDSFSRNPQHRDVLLGALEARNGDLRQMKAVIRGFDIKEHCSEEPWNGGMKAPEGKEITDSWPGVVRASDVSDLPGKGGSGAPDKAALVYTVGAGGRSG